MFKKTIFWSHLIVGVSLGVLILLLSITGAILVFDNQFRDHAFTNEYSVIPEENRLSLNAIVNLPEISLDERKPKSIIIYPENTDSLRFAFGHGSFLFVNPYNGEILGNHRIKTVNFMNSVFLLHGSLVPFFSMETRNNGQSLTGITNLSVLFLLVSGMYLWLPKIFKWKFFKRNILFDKSVLSNSKKRDYNWHLVLGFWSSIPLLIIVVTATFMEYDWALKIKNSLAENFIGTEEVQKVIVLNPSEYSTANNKENNLDSLVNKFKNEYPEWQSIMISLPISNVRPLKLTVDEGNGRQPQKRTVFSINQYTSEILKITPFSAKSKSDQNLFLRFLHTGEVFGLTSQIIAMITSLFCIVTIWCGLALAFRRLILSKL